MDPVQKEGYLEKESLFLKRFRKRWIVLKVDKLYSYKDNKKSCKPTEIINLTACKNVIKIHNGFTLILSNNKTRSFHTLNINDINDWIQCHSLYLYIYVHHKLMLINIV